MFPVEKAVEKVSKNVGALKAVPAPPRMDKTDVSFTAALARHVRKSPYVELRSIRPPSV
jgi:hypothetical protein